jgi:hypothetical protein
MKCISLYNPWAYLISIGAKKIETRSWYTSHRGLLLIHAADKWNKNLADICNQEPFYSALKSDNQIFSKNIFSFGCIIAMVDLYDCQKIINKNESFNFVNSLLPEGDEYSFGDYNIGRYMWLLRNIRRIESIRFRGNQGLFNVPNEIIKKLKLQSD